MEKLIIIGSGPAAYTAAIYSARADLDPLVYEGFMAGGIPAGGQLTTTTDVENYPGFPDGVQGPELMERMRRQSLRFQTRIKTQTVTRVEIKTDGFNVVTDSETQEARCLIIATGATAKRLNLPGEKHLWQKGISACAVCDGALPIFRNKVVAIIGGGDSAAEEATYLTKYASKVCLVHRRDSLRASVYMQDKLLANKKIEVIWDTVAVEAIGDKSLTGIKLKNVKTGQERVLNAGGLFYAVGFTPNTGFLTGLLELDESGYIKTKPGTTQTSVPGIFAAGDVQDKLYRQAVTAAGSGCMAALDAQRYLER